MELAIPVAVDQREKPEPELSSTQRIANVSNERLRNDTRKVSTWMTVVWWHVGASTGSSCGGRQAGRQAGRQQDTHV